MRFFVPPRNRGYSGINRIAAQKPEFSRQFTTGDILTVSNLASRAAPCRLAGRCAIFQGNQFGDTGKV